MDLNKLKDIKMEDLVKKPLFLLQIGIVIFSFIVAKKINMNQIKKVQEVKVEIEKEHEYDLTVGSIQKSKVTLDEYKKLSSPYNDTSFIINTVSQYANGIGIRFNSIRPLSIKEINPYAYLSLSLSSQMNSFKELGTFISLIESSPKFLQIDTLRFFNTSQEIEEKPLIQAEIVVSAYYLK